MFSWKTFPQMEQQLRARNYIPSYNADHDGIITSEVCPTCNISLNYIGYKNVHHYKAFMYCSNCRYWEEY